MDFDGARMRYLRAGSGPPLILLHGLMGYSYSWRYAMPALSPFATTYAPDLLGAGFSDRPRGIDHSMRGTALRVLQFAKRLGLSSFDLLGTSRGGAVAMCVAAECVTGNAAGMHLRRLILACPVNPYSSHGKRLAPFLGSTSRRGIVSCRVERQMHAHVVSVLPRPHVRRSKQNPCRKFGWLQSAVGDPGFV